MAPRNEDGRQARPWWKKEGNIVRFVPGFNVRNVNPDFDVIEGHSPKPLPGMPYIPKGQIWIDERFEGEKDFLLKVLWHERQCPEAGEKARRRWLNARLAERSGPPSRQELAEITVRAKRQGKLLIRYVRGEKVRRWWDVWFVFGGHDIIYPDYIPKNEIWLDIRQDPREIKYVLHHEMLERKLMSRGMTYARAHKLATESEQRLRSREIVKPRGRRKKHPKRLEVPVFSQRDCECGNTSLKAVCWFLGKRYSARTLGRYCRLSGEGIDHEPLALGAAKTGANVFMREEGSLSELRWFLEKGLPVLVGWWSLEPGYSHFDPSWNKEERAENDCGHYSVVCRITDEWVELMDPQVFKTRGGIKSGGYRKMRIKDFLEAWYDTDGPDFRKVERWYMVVNYEGKTFADRFKGGRDYLPG